MKYLNILIALVFLGMTSCTALLDPSSEEARICNYLCNAHFSPMVGFSSNTKSGDGDYGDSSSKLGGILGFAAPVPVSDELTLEPGLMLNSRGSRFETDFSGDGIEGTYEEKTTDTYLSAPLMARYSPIPKARGFNLIGGVQPSFLLGSKTKTTSSFGEDQSTSGTDGRNKLDAGLLVGAGYQFNFGLKVDAVYDHGLVNLWKEGGDFKSRSFRVVLGYRLPFNPYSKASWKKN